MLSIYKSVFYVFLCNINENGVSILRTLNKIIQLLDEQNKNQKELTDYLCISKNVFTDWKSGRNKSYTKHLPKIAEFFGVTVDYLVSDSDVKEKTPAISESDLTEEELELVQMFRSLSEESKAIIMGGVRNAKNQ